MSRYIDADKLKKFIDEKWKELADKNVAERGKELLYVSEKSYNLGLRDGKMEQKPVEWSKEDENRFNNLCWVIDDSKWNEASKQGFKNFLNALRSQPHWKPSEEQMWALDVALENFYHKDDRAALESLRTDLKNYFSHEIH